MKSILRASTLFVAVGLGAAGAFGQAAPGTAPPAEKGAPKATPAPKIAPMQPASPAGPTHAAPQPGQLHAGPEVGTSSPKGGLMPPHTGGPGLAGGTMDRTTDRQREFHPGPGYGVANRWGREAGDGRLYGMRSQRFTHREENAATWSPRYRHAFVRAHEDRRLRYGYGPRPYAYGARYREYGPGRGYRVAIRGYADRRPAYAYAPRFSYYRPHVRYAYAETPFAYDLPRETYATGIFPTVSAIGLHSYGYAYTTRIRPIAAYGGATGSYAGGVPIYNRPLAPAYPTPGCDCD